jgi:hypothetical protein
METRNQGGTFSTRVMAACVVSLGIALGAAAARAQEAAPAPAALGVPQPGPATDRPYAPQPILQGGVVVPLYPPDSKVLKADRVREPEQYNLSKAAPGRIGSIVNIHNPSIEFHPVEGV